MNTLEFIKTLFLCILYLTGIIACFSLMVGFVESIFDKYKKNTKSKVININGNEFLDEETKKELDKIAEKIAEKYANEMLSDEYEKED